MYETIASRHSDWFIPPLIFESIFFLTYLVGYSALRRQLKERLQDRNDERR
jgi:hypothetical protein